MSQSDKSDINKKDESKVVGEGSEPVTGETSADPTEEVVSAVNQYFGIGSDSVTINGNEKVRTDSRNISKTPSRSVTQNPPSENTEDDLGARRMPETSKTTDPKPPPSPITSRSVRDLSSGRILTKTNSERQADQRQQGSTRPSLDQTESVISAVTQYFGIGKDPSQTKTSTNVRNEQIIAASKVVGHPDSSTTTKKQTGGSRIHDTKVPSTVIAKQKSSLEASTAKGETVSVMHASQQEGGSNDGVGSQQLSSLPVSERPSTEPTESVVSAVKQQFGIGQLDSVLLTMNMTSDGNKRAIATAQNVVNSEIVPSETRKQRSESKTMDTKVPSTLNPKQKLSSESNTKDENVASESIVQSSGRKPSQPVDVTNNDINDNRKLREVRETTPKRVSIVKGSTTHESIVPIVTDKFGISYSTQSSLVSKSIEPLVTASSRKLEGETRSKEPVPQNDTSATNETPYHVVKAQLDYPISMNEEETTQMIDTNKVRSNTALESKLSHDPDVLVKPIPVAVVSQTPVPSKAEKSNVSPTPGASSKVPQSSDLPPKTEVPLNPTAVVVNKPGGQEPQNKSLSITNSNDPQKISKSDVQTETPRVMDDQKQPVTNTAAFSEVPSSPATATLPIQPSPNNKGSPEVHPSSIETKSSFAARAEKSPRTVDDRKPDASRAHASRASLSPTVLADQDSKKSGEATAMASDGVEAIGLHKLSALEVPSTNETISEDRKNVVTDEPENPRSLDVHKQPDAGRSLQPYGSSQGSEELISPIVAGQSPTVDSQTGPATVSGKPQTVAMNKTETPHTIDDIQMADSTKASPKMPPTTPLITPTTDINVSPLVMNAQTSSKDKELRANDSHKPQTVAMNETETPREELISPTAAGLSPTVEIQPIPATASGKPQTVSMDKTETPRTIYDIQKADSTKAGPNMSPTTPNTDTNVSPLVINAQAAGKDEYLRANDTLKPQTVAVNKTEAPRKMDDTQKADSTKASLNMPPPTPTTDTNVSLLINAQADGKDEDTHANDALKDGRSVETDKAGASKVQLVSREVPHQPQSVTTNDMETQRTLEDQKRMGTTITPKPASSLGQSSRTVQTSPVSVNTQDLRQETTNTASSIDVLPPPIQSTKPPMGVTNAGSTAVAGVIQEPQPVTANAAETLRTMEEHEPIEAATTQKPTAVSSPTIVTTQPQPVAVSSPFHRREEADRASINAVSPPSIQSEKPSKVPATAGSTAIPETLRTIEEHGPIETTSPKPSSPSPIAATPQSPPVIVNAQDRRQRDMNGTTDIPTRSTEPEMGVTSATASPVPIRGSHTSTVTARQCWICFATDEDELGLPWIQPCKCKGTTKWVHQSCLQMWVDEKLREHREKKVACPQCRTEYLIFLPKANVLVRSLDQVDDVIFRVCPFIAAGVVIGSFYWNAVTYGAIVMLQVAGSEGASVVAETFQPTVIIVGLPFIPLSLIVFRLFQWEDSVLHILRTTSHCVPLLHNLLPGHVVNETGTVTDVPAATAMSFQRVLVGALLTPLIAKVCGNFFFSSITSPVWRTVFGGALFVSVKGLIKMYHKQQTYKRLSRRKILDYTDENKRLIDQSRPLVNQVVPTPLRFQFVASVENRTNRRR